MFTWKFNMECMGSLKPETQLIRCQKNALKHGYFQLLHTPGLITHIPRPVWFTLVVGNFGIKSIGKENAQHLLKVFKEFYKVKEDWKGESYFRIVLNWNYKEGYVDIAMENYIENNL